MQVLGVILARGGSTRIPRKNMATVGGKALVAHAAEAAGAASTLTDTVVSTDCQDIAAVCASYGIPWVKRPAEISGPNATIEEATKHAMEHAELQFGRRYDYVVGLQAAVPVRPAGAIDALVRAVARRKARGGVTAIRRTPWIWRLFGQQAYTWWTCDHYPRSQDVQHVTLEEINSIQVTPRIEVERKQRWGNPLVLLELPAWADVDIDEPVDLAEAGHRWESIEAVRGERRVYPEHFICPPMPKIRGPLEPGMCEGRIGIVLANGPQIDSLPDAFFRKVEGPDFVTIGVNRIAASVRCQDVGFTPDLHLIWDAPRKGEAVTEAMRGGLEAIGDRTYRLVSNEHSMDYYPHDQMIRSDDRYAGHPCDVHMQSVVTDAAVNVLYRLGVKEVYLYGVEMNDGRHCEIRPPEKVSDQHHLNHEAERARLVGHWKTVLENMPDMQVYSACRESRLVRDGVCLFVDPLGNGSAQRREARAG